MHGLHGLTKTAAAEYAAQGIRINVVCPGAHLTPMLEVVFDRLAPGAPDKAAAMYRARIPMNRIGDPAECARAIAWLLSDAASYGTKSRRASSRGSSPRGGSTRGPTKQRAMYSSGS
jgi:NAD(P)-dependent dehydrogenase (short-subunit alcohol dehydrogenase family)